jgi:predicted site-specific integrase-resolvase
VTVVEAADELGVSRWAVYKLIKKGLLAVQRKPFAFAAPYIRLDRRDVARLARDRKGTHGS